MGEKIKLGDIEYDVSNLSSQAKATIASLKFANARMLELRNIQALLESAKTKYVEHLKKEVLARKSGVIFDED